MRRRLVLSSLVAAASAFIGCLDGSPPEPIAVQDGVVAAERPEISVRDHVGLGCGPAIACDDGDPCTVDSCLPGQGCQHRPAPNGTACDDGNACTQIDQCNSGACRGSDLVTCASPDSCHDRGSCDPATGACSNPPKPDGATCDDGNACTEADTCEAGTCKGAELSCDADHCHVARGTCNPATGFCAYPAPVPPPPRCTVTVASPPFEITGTCTEDSCVEGASRFRRGSCGVRYLCVPE